jgi:hypothetical protein
LVSGVSFSTFSAAIFKCAKGLHLVILSTVAVGLGSVLLLLLLGHVASENINAAYALSSHKFCERWSVFSIYRQRGVSRYSYEIFNPFS